LMRLNGKKYRSLLPPFVQTGELRSDLSGRLVKGFQVHWRGAMTIVINQLRRSRLASTSKTKFPLMMSAKLSNNSSSSQDSTWLSGIAVRPSAVSSTYGIKALISFSKMVSIALEENDRTIRAEDDVMFLHQLCDKFTSCAAHLPLAQINEGIDCSAVGTL